MKLKEIQKVERPREKLERYGAQKLDDHELVAILLGSGVQGTNVLQLSKKILQIISKIGKEKITLEDLRQIKGLGTAKSAQIISIIELTKRLSAESSEILTPEDVWKLCADIRESKKEHFVVFYLDAQNRLIERQIVSIGTLTTSLVHPREVFEPAITLHAASILVAHNHPSGVLEPSQEDKEVTKRLVEAGKILGIEVLDHIILGKSGMLSFQQRFLLTR